jgi:hypothetical protein
VPQVLLDDLVDVAAIHIGVPDRVRVHHGAGTFLAAIVSLVTGSARGPGREVRPNLFWPGGSARLEWMNGVARQEAPMSGEGRLPSGE